MRSKASFKGHAIHPALIPFPLAFLFGAFGFDVAGRITQRDPLWTTGGYLAIAGIIAALAAAVPGLIDYLYTVPPHSTGKDRATRHLTINLSAVALFLLAATLRHGAEHEPSLVVIAAEAIAIVLLTTGSWLGGTLVARNQIGIDHRYAQAGKWSELVIAGVGDVRVARSDELQVDQMRLVRAGSLRIVVARTESGWVAFDDRCTHRGASLADGVMMCGTVQCPWHGSQFDAASGMVKAGPAKLGIRTYAITERDGAVYLYVPGGATL